jgi:enamine deaminase RidA (YjgF/YER057c/UK114 family)
MSKPLAVWTVPTLRQHAAPIPMYTEAKGFVFFSAIRGVDHETGDVPADGREQARMLFQNLSILLKSAKVDWSDVVKVGLYMSNLEEDREFFNQEWTAVYGDGYSPARFGVQVVDIGIAGDATRFVLDVIAVRPEPLASQSVV